MAATVAPQAQARPASAAPAGPEPPELEVCPTTASNANATVAPRRRRAVAPAVARGKPAGRGRHQAYLIEGQVNLVQLQQDLNTQLGQHRELELQVAQLEQPTRIVSAWS